MKIDEMCLQSDGAWCFFMGNVTVRAIVYSDMKGNLRLRPLRGDAVQFGSWIDLEDEEVAEICKEIEPMLTGISLTISKGDQA